MMPHTNRKPPAPPPKTELPQNSFVNTPLSADDVFNVKMAAWGEEQLNDAITRTTMEGYKLSVRYDTRNQCFAAWFISPVTGVNKGLILAGRGSTPSKAIKQLAYIHFKLLECDWTAEGDIPTAPIDD